MAGRSGATKYSRLISNCNVDASPRHSLPPQIPGLTTGGGADFFDVSMARDLQSRSGFPRSVIRLQSDGGVADSIGHCINRASKTANGKNKIVVSSDMRDAYPKGEGGQILFGQQGSDGYPLLWKNYSWD